MTSPGVAPLWTVLIAFTATGQVLGELPWETLSYTDALDWATGGTATVTVPLRGADQLGQQDRQLLASLYLSGPMFSLAIVRGQRCLWAGPILTVDVADIATISCGDINKIFEGRIVCPPAYLTDPLNAAATLSYQLPAWDLVTTLLALGTTNPAGGAGRTLPLTLPAVTNQGGPLVTYNGADLGTVMERITDQVHADGGPDVYLAPQVSIDAATLGWAALVGQPHVGSPTPVATIDIDADILMLEVDADFSQLTTTGYVPGGSADNASGTRSLGVHSATIASPTLAFERVDRTSVSTVDQVALAKLATSYVAAYSQPVITWSVAVLDAAGPFYGEDYVLGDMLTLAVVNHPVVADGNYLARLIAIPTADDASTQLGLINPVLVG